MLSNEQIKAYSLIMLAEKKVAVKKKKGYSFSAATPQCPFSLAHAIDGQGCQTW